MKIEVVNNPEPALMNFFEKQIEAFNQEHWEIKEKKPIVLRINDESGAVLAGISAKTFGFWLLIENLWVDASLRGQDLGTQLLNRLESEARNRGCKYALLDTLNFQAKPFYEKHGYQVEWTQSHYPRDGCKHFMAKEL